MEKQLGFSGLRGRRGNFEQPTKGNTAAVRLQPRILDNDNSVVGGPAIAGGAASKFMQSSRDA